MGAAVVGGLPRFLSLLWCRHGRWGWMCVFETSILFFFKERKWIVKIDVKRMDEVESEWK